MTSQKVYGLGQSIARILCLKNRCFFTCISTICFLSLTPTSAWSFQTTALTEASLSEGSQALLKSPPPASADGADACAPLLQAIRYGSKAPYAGSENSASLARDRRNVDNRSAPGMMVGVLLGVKFALGPKERSYKVRKKAPQLQVWSVDGQYRGGRNVLSISAYRSCKKEQALSALNDFRWQR